MIDPDFRKCHPVDRLNRLNPITYTYTYNNYIVNKQKHLQMIYNSIIYEFHILI